MGFSFSKGLLFLAILNSSLETFTCIIYNGFTGRCIHMKSRAIGNNNSVLALPCTWRKGKGEDNGFQSMQDELLEFVPLFSKPISNRERVNPAEMKYVIRKTLNSQVFFMKSQGKIPVSSTEFDSPFAKFKLVHLAPVNSSRRRSTPFKIIDNSGNCLTLKPGSEALLFKECSRRNIRFQQWLMCRQNKRCDVDILWTPKGIHFSDKSGNQTESQRIMKEENSTYKNEVLYTIQNSLQIFQGTEDFLLLGVESFYPKELLADAQNLSLRICRAHKLHCFPCHQNYAQIDALKKSSMTKWLYSWVHQCLLFPQARIKFLSENILQVPYHLFPHHDSPNVSNFKEIIPSLKKLLDFLEKHANPGNNANGVSSSTDTSAQSEFGLDIDGMLDIDIRFGKKNHSSTQMLKGMEVI